MARRRGVLFRVWVGAVKGEWGGSVRRAGLIDWESACALSVASETPDTEIMGIARPTPIPSIKTFS